MGVSDTAQAAISAQVDHIEATSPELTDTKALLAARDAAAEFGLDAPDEVTGQLLTTLAASNESSGAVAVTPAAAVAGLYILRGLSDKQTVTCIDPEVEHQTQARGAFKAAGYATSRSRFLPSRPLEVMGRLAYDAYHLVYVDVAAVDTQKAIELALPLLSPGGTIVVANSLLDGTIADATRRDRETTAMRETDAYVLELEEVVVARLPLGAGLTLITKPA